MQRRSTVGAWCDRIIESGWLLALVLIPIYFNLLSARHFEPDKATSLRSIVLVMLGAWIIRGLDGLSRRPPAAENATPTNPLARAWRWVVSTPLALPVLVYVAVFALATATSVVPRTSFFGSYQRLQGTYTNLSYVLLFALVISTLRRREQLERMVTVMLLSSLAVAGYGVLQHFQLDPLPWKGDVITRVASTMGNSIFVAAYMILIVPFALYRLADGLNSARKAEQSQEPGADVLWTLAYLLLIGGGLALLLGSIKFAASVRTADFRYWWVYPGAICLTAWFFTLPTLRLRQRSGLGPAAVLPGFLLLLYIMVLALLYTASSGAAGIQAVDENAVNGLDWGWWTGGGVLLIVGFYALAAFLPRSEEEPTRLSLQIQSVGAGLLVLLLLLAVFFTQSRGPWLGGFAALFVFVTLLLWRATVRARGVAPRAYRLLRGLLVAEFVAAVALGGFLLAFNLSDAPVFKQLRDVPYVGRMGRLLEVDEGTGKVRVLIWRGDDKAGGAVALILSEPLRTLVGWGPESMFVAYNKYYPPSLANIEARGASPDRSHQAILDELVTKGFLGLISYLYLLVAFGVLAWRLIRSTIAFHWQLFGIAALSVVVGHFVESFVGIPIVSTLMMLWVTMGMTVATGAMAGLYSLGREEQPVPAVATAEAAKGTAGKRKNVQGQRRVVRGVAAANTARREQGGAAAYLVYGLVVILTLVGVWAFNFNVVYADMRFQQGQAFGAGQDPQQQLTAFTRYLDAIRLDTDEDFYYLNFGRTLMALSDLKRQQSNGQLGEPKPDAKVGDLLRLSDAEATSYIAARSPLEILSYAEATLDRARQLNSRNKDHYANLARLNNFWHSLTGDQQRLYQAEEWYRKASEVAPQDIVIQSEWAGVLVALGNFDEADRVLKHAKELDPIYADVDVRRADLARAQGKLDEAVGLYGSLLAQNPHQLDQSIQQIVESLKDRPELLTQLHDAYAKVAAANPADDQLQNVFGLLAVRSGNLPSAAEAYSRAVQSQPENLQYRRNYALVLSDTNRLPEALEQAKAATELAQRQAQQAAQGQPAGQGQPAQPSPEVAALQGLVQLLEAKVNGS